MSRQASPLSPTIRCGLAVLLLLASSIGTMPATAAVLQLITPTEAALAEPTLRGRNRELDDGPMIEIESPRKNGIYSGPFPVKVYFRQGRSGLPVNIESLRLTYQKLWGVDITDRVRDYLQQDAILAPEAELPNGRHTVEIYIEDIDQNPSTRLFTVTVE